MEEYQDHSLGGRVFQKIREDILNGIYKENDELRENTIGKELGVSRTPVREALRQLELEGLVTIIPNRGAYVTGISHKDIWDIYVIRSMLEGLCARWAVEHITDAQLDELEETILLSEFQMKKESGFSGGGTGYIGDPSGRTDMRSMMTPEQICHNCDCFKEQMSSFIDFSEGKALMVNNADWLLDLNYVELLREVGPHFSVNRMLTAECYKQRMEKG